MKKIKIEHFDYKRELLSVENAKKIEDKFNEIVKWVNEQEARYKKINEWIAGINEDIMEIQERIDKKQEN